MSKAAISIAFHRGQLHLGVGEGAEKDCYSPLRHVFAAKMLIGRNSHGMIGKLHLLAMFGGGSDAVTAQVLRSLRLKGAAVTGLARWPVGAEAQDW